jgi:type I restriction-modification system DNA methylase subunit
MTDIVQKLWGFCHTPRHDGIDYGDYIDQITYLLFLKMADERGIELPKKCDWPMLPRGTFTPYSQGVKANVIFFQKGYPTEHVWIFDARSNVPGITKKDRPLTTAHFAEFEKCYGEDPNGKSKRKDTGETGRFRRFNISEVKERDYKLDITWLKDESLDDAEDLPEPQDLAAQAITELEAVVDDLREIVALIEKEETVAARAPVRGTQELRPEGPTEISRG